jgi:WS/DGAT/MGAT family acyltransferase
MKNLIWRITVAKFMSALDSAFLHMESHDTPMHVAGLQIFTLPKKHSDDFLQKLVQHLRNETELSAPWNQKLRRSPVSKVLPSWQTDHDVDMEYHVRHLSLPYPGGERQLGELISRLHSHRLTQRRPLWECHVIEGLENNRFALFIKIHHSLVDGITAMRLLVRALATDADTTTAAPWSASYQQAVSERTEPKSQKVTSQLKAIPEVAKAFAKLARSAGSDAGALVAPMLAPRSVLNASVSGQRRFATQHFSLARIKGVARAAGVTVNDVVLAICSSSLRRFLKESNNLPKRSLTAMVPVSLRGKSHAAAAGNSVGAIIAGLATDVADPKLRLQKIAADTANAKAHLADMSAEAASQYSTLFMVPVVLQAASRMTAGLRPYFNVTISNVPGPSEPLYLLGARLEAMYPVSVPTHGQCLNITCTSYAGTVNFGFTACRDALPHMQNIAVYAQDALLEIEQAYGVSIDVGVATEGAKKAK